MNQFKSNYFKFDGVSSEDYGYMLVEVGDSNNEVVLGLNRDINREDSSNGLGIFKGVKDNYHNIPIQIIKYVNGQIQVISDNDAKFLNRWLFCNTYKPLEVDNGLVYYVLFKGMKGQYYSGGTVLNLELESLPTSYTPIRVVTQNVIGTRTIEVSNITTINEMTPVDVYVSMIEGTSFTITNLSTGKSFSISGLQANEEFYIYGERHFIESKVDSKRNLYKLSNKVFDLDLRYGKNKLKIDCTNATVQILFQSKMALQ